MVAKATASGGYATVVADDRKASDVSGFAAGAEHVITSYGQTAPDCSKAHVMQTTVYGTHHR